MALEGGKVDPTRSDPKDSPRTEIRSRTSFEPTPFAGTAQARLHLGIGQENLLCQKQSTLQTQPKSLVNLEATPSEAEKPAEAGMQEQNGELQSNAMPETVQVIVELGDAMVVESNEAERTHVSSFPTNPKFVVMNCIVWNCNGASKADFDRKVNYLARFNQVDILVLLEPKIYGVRAYDFQETLKWRFLDVCCVGMRGFTGGLWLFWDNNSVLASVIRKGLDFIHAIIKKGKAEIQYIFVYAPPSS
ncbi:hypothetical protein V2J09_014616 [Rumex salicifolius]